MSDTKITEVGAPTAIAHRTMAAERVTLVIHEGDAPDPTTRVIELADGMSITLGRSRTCEVQIDSERVSRTHATFVRTGATIEVFDAGSRNGTWLRGAPIVARQPLTSGDEVIVGSATVLVSITQRVVVPVRIESTRYLEERLAAEVDRGVHYHRRFGLALLQIGGPPELADAASDRLAASLRPMDGIAEYAPGLLAIVMPELDAGETARAATDLVALVGATIGAAASASIHVGVASFPEHSTTTGGLIARAAAALAAVAGGVAGAAVVGLPPAERAPALDEIIVRDPQMVRVYELVKKVADHPITVLIRGETGVGKEVIAAALHAASSRRTASLVSVNCASLPEALLESALFGHERGAFTGADRRKIGYFEAAHGGTLFSTRSARCRPRCRPSCCACSRTAGSSASAAPTRSRPTSACCARRIAISRPRRSPAASGWTSTSGSAASRSSCRRSGTGPTRSSCSRARSSARAHARSAGPSPSCLPTRWSRCVATSGPGTCASCATRWSARWCSTPAR
ncbi:MAG: sigma 54-interacting transcriptional regulator [Proteobacteria bacterium]|nr:sigma 54-interacting transcriptional regulator [Pseudomonadota bacterium]